MFKHRKCPDCGARLKGYYYYCGQCGCRDITDWKMTLGFITFAAIIIFLVYSKISTSICTNLAPNTTQCGLMAVFKTNH